MVKHVLGEEETILSFVDFQGRLPNVGLHFFSYHGLVSSKMTTRKEKRKKEKKKKKKKRKRMRTLLSLDSDSKPWSVILKRG